MIVSPWYPVPPVGYGGIELMAYNLASELHLRGHQVTVIGQQGSKGPFETVAVAPESWSEQLGTRDHQARESLFLYRAYHLVRRRAFDVVHDHSGLPGILFAPFLHGSLNHIVANSIPFLLFGWLILLRDPRHFVPVTMIAMIGSGLMAWLFGAPGSIHIGASGVIFGYLGFLIVSGWYVRSLASVALSVFVTVVWGSLILGVMPGAAGISWQAHLGGFIAGVLTARTYRTSR